jgi:hypothetical protein
MGKPSTNGERRDAIGVPDKTTSKENARRGKRDGRCGRRWEEEAGAQFFAALRGPAGGAGGDERNVAAANADILELAIGKLSELPNGFTITAPSGKLLGDGLKRSHRTLPSLNFCAGRCFPLRCNIGGLRRTEKAYVV